MLNNRDWLWNWWCTDNCTKIRSMVACNQNYASSHIIPRFSALLTLSSVGNNMRSLLLRRHQLLDALALRCHGGHFCQQYYSI